MNFLTAPLNDLPPGLHARLAHYRHRVFVERLGWNLDTQPGYEQDQFDHEGTVHIVARNDSGRIVGCGRLLPCTGPYLLESVFPQLLNGAEAPRGTDVWELSRFAATDFDAPAQAGRRRDHMAERVLLEALRFCAARGVKTLVAVSTLSTERLMLRAGVDVHRMGAPAMIDGQAVLGFVIAVNEQSIMSLTAFEVAAHAQSRPLGPRPGAGSHFDDTRSWPRFAARTDRAAAAA
jgi:N-acyl-L-homoserine lactone synthetase